MFLLRIWSFVGIFVTFFSPSPCEGMRLLFPDEYDSVLNELNSTDSVFGSYLQRGECRTQQNVIGKCVTLEECPELLNFLATRGGISTPGTSDYMRERICGFEEKTAKLCCLRDDATAMPGTMPLVGGPGKPVSKILPSFDECGITSGSRISRGKSFGHGEHPWLVGVGYLTDEGAIKVECGGTLITKKHVLSAAHCFDDTPERVIPALTHVVLGEHDLTSDEERLPPVVMRIAEKKSPGYDPVSRVNDIELLVLEREVDFHNYITPACLPLPKHVKDFDLENEDMTILGWGKTHFYAFNGTDEPLKADVPLVPKSVCKEAYDFAPEVPLDKRFLCLGADGKDACPGDSGGPVIYNEGNVWRRYFLVGITSFGVSCGNSDFPGVYTFVPEYIDWILENL